MRTGPLFILRVYDRVLVSQSERNIGCAVDLGCRSLWLDVDAWLCTRASGCALYGTASVRVGKAGQQTDIARQAA